MIPYSDLRIDLIYCSGNSVLRCKKNSGHRMFTSEANSIYGNRDFSVLRQHLFFRIFDGNNAPNIRELTVNAKATCFPLSSKIHLLFTDWKTRKNFRFYRLIKKVGILIFSWKCRFIVYSEMRISDILSIWNRCDPCLF